jgi:hypothetical protein
MPRRSSSNLLSTLLAATEGVATSFVDQRKALEAVHERIGQILADAGKRRPATNGKTPKPAKASGPKKRGRKSSADINTAKERVAGALKRIGKNGVGRGALAKELGFKPELVSQVLKLLAAEKTATVKGQKRNALWFSA